MEILAAAPSAMLSVDLRRLVSGGNLSRPGWELPG